MFRRFLELADTVGKVADERSAGLVADVVQEFSAAMEGLGVSTEEIEARNDSSEAARSRIDLEMKRYRELFEGAPDWYVVTDHNGIITESNRASTELLGVDSRLLRSKPLIVFVDPRDRRTLLSTLHRVLDQAKAECEVRFSPLSGRVFPASVRATSSVPSADRRSSVRWLIRDVSQWVAAEAALALEEERYRLIAANISDVVITTDRGDRILFASPSTESILGRTRSELESNHISFLFHPDDWPALTALEARVRDGDPQATTVLRTVGPSGDSVAMQVTVAAMRDDSGEATGLCYTMHDDHEREEARLALQAALTRERQAAGALREADAAKDALLLAASHDLSSPVAAVAGLADQLAAHPELPEGELRRIADGIASAGSQLRSILSTLLDAERVLGGHVVVRSGPTDLHEIVLRSATRHGLPSSSVRPQRGPVLVNVDGGLTARIVDNVVGNALRHTPAGTPIRMSLDHENGEVIFSVADRGPGVPDDLKNAIFEPFRRQTSHVSGLGLGLFVVRRFAELQAGRSWVEDTEGGGATFKVALPAASREG